MKEKEKIVEIEKKEEDNEELNLNIGEKIKTTLAIIGLGTVVVWGFNKLEDSFYKLQPRMEIEIDEPKEEKEIIIEEEKETQDISTWTTYDQNTSYFKVNVDNMYSDFIVPNIKQCPAIDKQKDQIGLYLGDNVYTKEIGENYALLTNLKGREIKVSSEYGYGDDSCGLRYTNDDGYEVSIYGSETSYDYDYTKEYNWDDNDHYSEHQYRSDCPDYAITVRRDNFYISIYASSFIGNNISIWSRNGRVRFNVSKEEYEEMVNAIISYKRGRDIRKFFVDYKYLINKYLNEIEKENTGLYLEMVDALEQIANEKESGPLEDNKVKELEY